MSSIGPVESVERATDEGVPVVNVKIDPGGQATFTGENFAPAGDDSLPLPADSAVVVDASGRDVVVGYVDPKNEGKAAPGEKRTYARDAAGKVVAEIWAKANGDVAITSLEAGGKIILNGVEIDQQGNIKAPGEITGMAATTAVNVTTHVHPTGVGPSGPPKPEPAA